MKTSTDFQEAGYTPTDRSPPSRRLCNPAQDLEKRTLAGTVAANDAEHVAPLDLEAHIAQGPEFLDFIPLYDLPAPHKIQCPTRKIARLSGDHVAEALVGRGLMPH